MKLDEAIEFCKEKSRNIKLRTEPKTFEQIAEWLEELYEEKCNNDCDNCELCYEKGTVGEHKEAVEMAIKALEEIKQYRTIGTPEECRAAVEKQKAKKPIIEHEETKDCVTEIEWKCPKCGAKYIELAPCGEWCRYCGTKLDWGEEE